MNYPVWAIADDGPVAGFVFEADVSEKEVTLRADAAFMYKRVRLGSEKARIAHYAYVKTLVI